MQNNKQEKETFQPSYSLSKLLNNEQNGDEPTHTNQQFNLNQQYERLPILRSSSAEPKKDQVLKDLDLLFTFGGKEVKILDQIKHTTLAKQNTDTYKKYKQYLESEQDKIKDDKKSIYQKEVVEQIEVEDSIKEQEAEFDIDGYDLLMKPAQISLKQPTNQQKNEEISFIQALQEGQTVLLQLPTLIPFEQIIQTNFHGVQYKAKNVDDQAELMREYYSSNQYDAAGFVLKRSYQQIVSREKLKIANNQEMVGIRGELGKIVVQDGKSTWHVGEEEYAINLGIQTSKVQELVGLEGEKMQLLGNLGMKFVATPNVDSLICNE